MVVSACVGGWVGLQVERSGGRSLSDMMEKEMLRGQQPGAELVRGEWKEMGVGR
jgi:hypothetical protein